VRHARVCRTGFQLLASRGGKVSMYRFYELICCYKELCVCVCVCVCVRARARVCGKYRFFLFPVLYFESSG
jgi:hypothetical protein